MAGMLGPVYQEKLEGVIADQPVEDNPALVHTLSNNAITANTRVPVPGHIDLVEYGYPPPVPMFRGDEHEYGDLIKLTKSAGLPNLDGYHDKVSEVHSLVERAVSTLKDLVVDSAKQEAIIHKSLAEAEKAVRMTHKMAGRPKAVVGLENALQPLEKMVAAFNKRLAMAESGEGDLKANVHIPKSMMSDLEARLQRVNQSIVDVRLMPALVTPKPMDNQLLMM